MPRIPAVTSVTTVTDRYRPLHECGECGTDRPTFDAGGARSAVSTDRPPVWEARVAHGSVSLSRTTPRSIGIENRPVRCCFMLERLQIYPKTLSEQPAAFREATSGRV